jgi:hypothetical protein
MRNHEDLQHDSGDASHRFATKLLLHPGFANPVAVDRLKVETRLKEPLRVVALVKFKTNIIRRSEPQA